MCSASSFSGRRIRASTSRSTGPVHDVSRRFLARLRRLPTCAMQARLADQAHLLHASSNDDLATVSACTGITGAGDFRGIQFVSSPPSASAIPMGPPVRRPDVGGSTLCLAYWSERHRAAPDPLDRLGDNGPGRVPAIGGECVRRAALVRPCVSGAVQCHPTILPMKALAASHSNVGSVPPRIQNNSDHLSAAAECRYRRR